MREFVNVGECERGEEKAKAFESDGGRRYERGGAVGKVGRKERKDEKERREERKDGKEGRRGKPLLNPNMILFLPNYCEN